MQVGCIPDVGWKAPLLPVLLGWNRWSSSGWGEQECYSLSAACGRVGIANINRDGMKNHVGRDAIARSVEDPGFLEKGRQGGGIRLKKGPIFSLHCICPVPLSLVQVPKCYLSGPGISPDVLRVNLLCLGLFSVRVFVSPPSHGVLLRLWLGTVLGLRQALLPGGMRAKGLLQAGGARRRGHREFWWRDRRMREPR